jgi:hypothetical protein
VQMQLIAKYKAKEDLLKDLQVVAGEGKSYIGKPEIFEFYRKATGKDKLSLEDKQMLFKFSENLRFREDDRKIEADDFADLVFGYNFLKKENSNKPQTQGNRAIHQPSSSRRGIGWKWRLHEQSYAIEKQI